MLMFVRLVDTFECVFLINTMLRLQFMQMFYIHIML